MYLIGCCTASQDVVTLWSNTAGIAPVLIAPSLPHGRGLNENVSLAVVSPVPQLLLAAYWVTLFNVFSEKARPKLCHFQYVFRTELKR